jgi:hypothetical protein
VNSLNVPSDASVPEGLGFALRTATLQFGGFPSLRRYSAETEIPRAQLAVDAFLGNPMMFYAHESFFASGAGAFNKIADDVNRIQPGTRWTTPGEIVQHLYLEKRRDDGDLDVLALSNVLRLRNDRSSEATFFITKYEDPSMRPSVLMNGRQLPSSRTGDALTLRVTLAPGAEDQIEFRDPSPDKTVSVDVSRRSPRTTAIRLLSDFRDNVVSNTGLGRWFIRSYAQHGSYWIVGFALCALTIAAFQVLSFFSRNKQSQSGNPTLIAG